MKKTFLLSAAAALVGMYTGAYAEEKSLDAHVHGVATLLVAQEGELVSVGLESPADTLLGFEHAASTDAERQVVSDLRAALATGDTVFRFNAEAECKVESALVTVGLDDHDDHDDHDTEDEHHDEDGHDDHDKEDEHHDEDGHDDHDKEDEHHDEDGHDDHDKEDEHHDEDGHDDHDDHEESAHSDIEAEWLVHCDAVANLKSFDVLMFGNYGNLEKLTVNVLSDSGAQAVVLEQGGTVSLSGS